jgi:SAM-dependent methyltransferase
MVCQYIYPASESVTDRLEKAMDPYKLERERFALSLAIQFDWRLALDVGCGVGRYFRTFAEATTIHSGIRRSLYAIEPDNNRRLAAIAEASTLGNDYPELEIIVVPGFEDVPIDECFDLITCSQVLGHLRRDACLQMLSTFRERRKKSGVIVLLLPAVLNDGVKYLVPWKASPDDDYCFAVDVNLMPSDEHYAEALEFEDFEAKMNDKQYHKLLVRAFNIGEVMCSSREGYPIAVALPRDLSASYPDMHAFSYIYTVHRFSPVTGKAILGDIIVRLSE